MAGESLKLGQLGPMGRYVLSRGGSAVRLTSLGRQDSFQNTTNYSQPLFRTAIPVHREHSPVSPVSVPFENEGSSDCVDACFSNLAELQSRMPNLYDLSTIKVTATDKEKAEALLGQIATTTEALNTLLAAASDSGLEISNDHSNEDDKRQSPPPFSQTVDVQSALLSVGRSLSPSSKCAPQGGSGFPFGALGSTCRAGTPPA